MPAEGKAAAPPRDRTWFILGMGFVLVSLLVAALLYLLWQEEELNVIYGRRGGVGAASVNGTAVLAGLFEQAGHRVVSVPRLTSAVTHRSDCIVWVPDSFDAPGEDSLQSIEAWLRQEPGRTFVYVGRDYDAAAPYWRAVLPAAPAAAQPLIQEQITSAEERWTKLRSWWPSESECAWFRLDYSRPPRSVDSLEGDPRWLEGVDASGLDLERTARLTPAAPRSHHPSPDVLLASEGDVLVARLWRGEGQVLCVVHGGFLLNLPLVNLEHRKLAGRLVDEIGPPGKTVVFLESESLTVADYPHTASPFAIFHTWPINWILLHLAVAGILFCFCRLPIFGRPRGLPPAAPSDFGKHIDALAELLARTGDHQHAMTRWLHFRQAREEKSLRPRPAVPELSATEPAEPSPGTRTPSRKICR